MVWLSQETHVAKLYSFIVADTYFENDYLRSLRGAAQIKVHMVCLGNICRSPMAAAVLNQKSKTLSTPKILVSSSGTGNWHVGDGANPKSKLVWEQAGYFYNHTAQQFRPNFFAEQDLILAMDLTNRANILNLSQDTSHRNKVFMLRSFDPNLGAIDVSRPEAEKLQVPDPYGEGISSFENVLKMIEAACDGLIDYLSSK